MHELVEAIIVATIALMAVAIFVLGSQLMGLHV